MIKFILLTLFSLNTWADIQVPTMTRPIIDETHTINEETIKDLEAKIFALNDNNKGPQLQVLVVNSLNGYSVEDVAEKVFNTWGLGQKAQNNGVLFLVAIKDRKMRIEVGYGLENSLTDYTSKQITTSVKPFFKTEDYSSGIRTGVEGILNVISQPDAVYNGQPVTNEYPKKSSSVSSGNEVEIGVVMVVLIFAGIFGTFGLSVLSKMSDGYSKSKHRFNKSVEKLNATKEEAQEIRAKFGTNDPEAFRKTLETEAYENNQESDRLVSLIRAEQRKQSSSPQAKYDDIMIEVSHERNKVNQIQSEISQYQQVIREGR